MSHTISIRLNKDLAEWLQDKAARSRQPQGKIIRDQLELIRKADRPKFMRLAGKITGGPRDVSSRKGFSTK